MADQPQNAQGSQAEEPATCGDTREMPYRDTHLRVTCSRNAGHDEDHFDERAGIGWLNEGSDIAGLTQEERVHLVLDRLGVPRGRDGNAWSLVQRQNLFVDRLARRLHDQVENNMILFTLCGEVRVLLEGAPGASNYRIKTAIEKLRQVTTVKRPGSKLVVTH